MPSKRQRQSNSTAKRARKSTRATHESKLRTLIRSGKRPDPTNRRAVARQYSEIKRRNSLERHYSKPATASQKKILKQKGFYVSRFGVVVDVPRDVHRQKIPHTKFSVLKDGTIKFTNTQRRDFIIGFTKAERKEFARDPEGFTKRRLEEFRRSNPTAAKYWRSKQVRLQWGAFQGTKAFAPSYFTKQYFATISEEERRERPRGKRRPRIDKLTGLHIVIHIPKASTARKRKRGRNVKRKKNRRT